MQKLKRFHWIVIVVLLSACAPAVTESPTLPPPTSTPVPPTATPYSCEPSPILTDSSPFPEIQGTMQSDGELWALLFFNTAFIDQEVKIVWRITGTGGEFTARAHNADGTRLDPFWGPQYHEDSTWERPGEEWGTSFIFPTPGCWIITVSYGETVGTIALAVSG